MAKKLTYTEVLAKFSKEKELTQVTIEPTIINDLWRGVHLGAVYSAWGIAGSGKSSIFLQVIRSLLSQGMTGVFVDVEKTLNTFQQECFGIKEFVDSGSLHILQGLKSFDELEELINVLPNMGISFIVIDSWTDLEEAIDKDKDKSILDKRPMSRAQQEGPIFKLLRNTCFDSGIAAFLVMHARANVSMDPYASRTTISTDNLKMAGSFDISHGPSVVMRVSPGGKIKSQDGESIVGVTLRLETEKNKFCAPAKVTTKLYFGRGIDERIAAIDDACAAGIIYKPPGKMRMFIKGYESSGIQIRKVDLYNIDDSTFELVSKLLKEYNGENED